LNAALARVPGSPLIAAALLVVWAVLYPRTPDLAAAFYRVDAFRHAGFAVWDTRWYGGHHMLGYSLLFAPLGSALGVRALACVSVLASTTLFELLVRDRYGPRARSGALLFAVAAVADVWIGRLAFALGVALALAATLAWTRGRLLAAVALAIVCAAASPVAGSLLALAGATHALAARSRRSLPALVLAPLAAIALLALLFPEGGFEPYPFRSFLATVAVIGTFVWALPRQERALRIGAAVYTASCVLALLVRTPVGSNVERYAVLLAGPLLVCALLSRGGRASGPPLARAVGARGAIALAGWAVFCVWGPIRETAAVAGDAATHASYYAPVERFLAGHGGGPVRIEVPLTRSHWEAAFLAPRVSLARGWEKQLDERYDGVLLGHGLNAGSYLRWLRGAAVAYVALPDARLDPSSAAEGRLVRAGLPYLREVFASAHWRIFAVRGATPIASGPGRVTSLGRDSFVLRAQAAGELIVRMHFTRYWTVTSGSACVRSAPGGWTSVRARSPGVITVRARFSLARALGAGASCP
jgi:hypothetical protein